MTKNQTKCCGVTGESWQACIVSLEQSMCDTYIFLTPLDILFIVGFELI